MAPKPMSGDNRLGQLLRDNIALAFIGKGGVIELALTALIARGHLLVEDVPGVGKTLLARALARSVDARFARVQFTPDLLPSDITGTPVFNENDRSFEFAEGPVFTNIFLGDELNRATPRTQSALLEAMEERQVSADGVTHPLPDPFFVIATQNPIEQHGVYPLPEAQLDRFLMQITVGYPSRADEIAVVLGQLEARPIDTLQAVAEAEGVLAAQREARRIHVDDTLASYAVQIVEATRTHTDVLLGGSPRASLALVTAAQAWTWLQGGSYVVPDTIKLLAPHILRHRLVLRPQSVISGVTADGVVAEVLKQVALPLGLD